MTPIDDLNSKTEMIALTRVVKKINWTTISYNQQMMIVEKGSK